MFGGWNKLSGSVNPNSSQSSQQAQAKQNGYNGYNQTNQPLQTGSNIITPKADSSSPSKVSSRGMSIALNSDNVSEIERYDKFLVSDSLSNKEDLIDFEYTTTEEIKNLLNKFLKSSKFRINFRLFDRKTDGFHQRSLFGILRTALFRKQSCERSEGTRNCEKRVERTLQTIFKHREQIGKRIGTA